MQQLVAHAASGVEPPRNVRVGEPLLAVLPRSAIGLRGMLTDPGGRRQLVTVADRGSRGVVEVKGAAQLGLYTLDFNAAAHPSIHFVVSSPRAESDLRQLTRDEIDTLAKEMGGDVVSSVEEYQALDKTRRHGSEVWHWFFWGVLAMCFLELFLQFAFAHAKKS
jgi:hypothetical protein